MNAAVLHSGLRAPLDVKLMNTTAWVLVLGFVVLGLATFIQWAARLPVFDIAGITVTGEVSHNSAINLRANVTPRIGGTFFTVDLNHVRGVFETMPWVRHAVVHRDFPNRLRVELQEHQAVAYWGGEGDSQLINNYGEVFEANLGEVEQDLLVRMNGPEGQSAEVLAMYRTLAPLYDALELRLEQIELTGRGSWRAHLRNGADIEMGRGTLDEVAARVQRFLKTITQVASQYGRRVTALESADLRHENGYAVRLQGVSTTVAAAPNAKPIHPNTTHRP
jgi:cell division protein FtsQ